MRYLNHPFPKSSSSERKICNRFLQDGSPNWPLPCILWSYCQWHSSTKLWDLIFIIRNNHSNVVDHIYTMKKFRKDHARKLGEQVTLVPLTLLTINWSLASQVPSKLSDISNQNHTHSRYGNVKAASIIEVGEVLQACYHKHGGIGIQFDTSRLQNRSFVWASIIPADSISSKNVGICETEETLGRK